MPLSSIGIGKRCRIKDVTGDDAVRHRLGALGFVTGMEVEIGGLPVSGYLPVGRYSVTVTIDDPNYAGSTTEPSGIVVSPRPAKIVPNARLVLPAEAPLR